MNPLEKTEYHYSHFAEHISSGFFRFLGIPSQETFLARRKKGDRFFDVCVCKLFTGAQIKFISFSMLKRIMEYDYAGSYDTELNEIIEVIENQEMVDPVRLKSFFYRLLVIDSLLGNSDRNLRNWGIICNEGKYYEAPVFDNARSLMSYKTNDEMKYLLENESKFIGDMKSENVSCIKFCGERIRPHVFFKEFRDEIFVKVWKDVFTEIRNRRAAEKIFCLTGNEEIIPTAVKDFFCKYIELSLRLFDPEFFF